MRERFVFLNVYTKSVKEEHDPRGPEGPYQFKDRSVPVIVVKKWDGETLNQTLGFVRDEKQGMRRLASILEKAAKDNGPVQAPKQLKPLLKMMAKAEAHLAKDRPGQAHKELAKIVKAGADTKAFPNGVPTVAEKAAAQVAAILEKAEEEIEAAADLVEEDAEQGLKAYRKLIKRYAQIPAMKKRLQTKVKALTEAK